MNSQTSLTSVIEEITHAIHSKTGLTSQQRFPIALLKMGLNPQSTEHAGHAQPRQTRSICGLNNQIQDLAAMLKPLRPNRGDKTVRWDTKVTNTALRPGTSERT